MMQEKGVKIIAIQAKDSADATTSSSIKSDDVYVYAYVYAVVLAIDIWVFFAYSKKSCQLKNEQEKTTTTH